MTNPYLRNTALLFAVIGVSLTGALAQGVAFEQGDDDGFVEEAVSPSVGDDSGNTAIVSRTFARANYVWPYASGPNYQSQVEANLIPGTPGVITTPVGVFRVGSGMPSLPAELRASMSASPAGGQYFYLLVNGGEEAALGLTNKISRDGGRVVTYDPNTQVMVAKVMGDTIGTLTAASGVVAYEPFHSALKLHPSIGRIPLVDPVRATSEVYTLDVLLFPGEDVNQVAASLSALGANVKTTVGARRFPKATVEVHRSKLAQIAALEPVMLVLENTPWMLLAEETTTTMQTGGYNQGATPYHDAGIDGGGGGGSFGFCSVSTNVGCTTVGGDTCTLPQGTCDTATEQILTIVDNGIQLDAGDLSNERADAGWNINQVIPNHRKVLAYETTGQFAAGQGDLTGCDLPLNGGRTHGHIVASTAIGNATNVDSSYNGPGWVATDQQEEFWALDGVAPGGRLVAYDAQVTPGSGSCDDPLLGLDVSLNPGQLYVSGGAAADGSLSEGYVVFGARSFNLSFGKAENAYGDDAIQVDEFLFDFRDAMVYIAAGNQGTDQIPPGGDGEADPLELQDPATAKNALAIGASRNADRVDAPESRAFFSSTGPAVNDTSVNRMAPHLMAPGDEANGGTLGLSSEFACRSSDNNQDDPVECDITAANEGTSFSAPAAAGSGMLVRDYFARGFYPAGVQDITEAVPTVSGNLVKGMLIASADFLEGVNVAIEERFNFEQGYGRIQLDNVLPLQTWAGSPSGLIVEDVLNGSVVINDIGGGITGRMNTSGAAQSGTFKVCNDKETLRVALTWTDPVDTDFPPSGRMVNDLNLKLTAPSGIVYRGNYYTDDNNRDDNINPDGGGEDEDCPAIGGIDFNVQIDAGQWALPICNNSKIPGTGATTPSLNDFDSANPMEAIFLSPNADGFREDTDGDGQVDSPTYVSGVCTTGSQDPLLPCGNHRDCDGGGTYIQCNAETGAGDCCEGGDLQTEPGTWTVEVSRGNTLSLATDYSLVIAGGVCAGSSVLVDQASYSCNGEVEIVVSEDTDGLSSAEIEQRTVVQVLNSGGTVVDEEDIGSLIPLNFNQDTSNRFASATVTLSAGTDPDSGNGVLDVNDGDTIQVIYTDVESGDERKASASVNCQVDLTLNAVLNAQYGQDQSVVFFGGCERNVRNKFELAGVGGFGGFPDRYLDADEFIQVDFIFQSDELDQLDSVDVSLSCVEVDADSPAECLPDGTNCTPANCGGPCDPRRENNPSCDGTIDEGTSQTAGTPYMHIVDPEKNIGILPELSTLGTRFSIQMGADEVSGDPFFGQPTPTVELVIRVADPTSGKQASGVGVNRIKLNVDAIETFYSTDFPMGGTAVEIIDRNQNEVPEDPIYEPGPGFQGLDYRFETRSFGNMLIGKDAQGATINRNQGLKSPWNFDGNDGGFTHGLGALTDETLVTTGIYNWGEDENFNNVEDGVCGGDRSIRCFKIGPAGSDPRCANVPGFPAARACLSIEDRAADGSGLANFNSNWSTKGGCGWQTRAPQTCDVITTRGCFTNDDCQGACINDANPIVSTFEDCFNDGDCSLVWQCSTSSDDPLIYSACGTCSISGKPCRDQDDSDCPSGETCEADSTKCGAGTCVSGNQSCDGEAGLCTGGQGGGGVWHTGVINAPTAVNFDDPGCFGSEPTNDCQIYRTISGTGDGLQWYNYLLTPVMEKVNQEEDVIGDPVAQIEIWNWAWNHSIDLPDNFVFHSWEMDTDVTKILPVDLTSDAAVLNSGNGQWGAITRGNNANLEDGWGLFAPMGTCGVKNCGGAGTPSSAGRCEVIEDCTDGGCSKGLCDKGGCRLCDPPSACDGVTCGNDDDCVNAPGQTGTGATCDSPLPNTETCADVAECDADLGGTGAACIGVGTSCYYDAFCQDEFGQDSACTLPSPQGCLPVAAGNTESPCQIDSQCGGGECVVSGSPCQFDSECDAIFPNDVCGNGTTADRAELCASSAVSVNGQDVSGNNRDGQNSCFFQGAGLITEIGRTELGIVEPIDNDLDDDLTTEVCAGDATKTCETAEDCLFKGTTGPCQFGTADGIDEYVTDAGPKRNFDLIDQPWNGPDMRFFTLEDIYGDTGNTFQGALGFITFQGTVGFPAKGGFGEAIDDMVVEWREFTLEADATDCDAGSCATVIIDTDRAFSGEKLVTYRLMDQSPYGWACDTTGDVCYPGDTTGRAPCIGSCVAAQNDCNYNGKFLDFGECDNGGGGGALGTPCKNDTVCDAIATGSICVDKWVDDDNPGTPIASTETDDDNCDNDGNTDVIVLLKSEAEPLGENTVANEILTGVYEGSIVTSSLGDTDGVLFIAQIGADNPTVTALYADNDDGTGNICENSIVPEQQGFAQDGSFVVFDEVCNVLVTGFSFSDNGDGDDFADTNETGTVTLDLLNNCGFDLTNCLMRLTSNDPEIDCVFNPIVPISSLPCSGDAPCTLAPGTSVQVPPFQFRIAGDVEGADPNDPPVVNFAMTMTCDQIDGLDQPQSFGLSLDLDIEFNPADVTDYTEGFEGSAGAALSDGGTTWEAQNNDFGIPGTNDNDGLINGDGYRCQYSDPDWPNSGSAGNAVETNCFPGTRNNADLPWWQIDGQNISDNQVDDGRAKTGTRSMYYGKYDEVPSNPDATDPFVFTTLAAVIEAAGTTDPINLGVDPSPVLSWWQQISLIDGRTLTINTTRSADRGVVQLQLADTDDSPIGDWIKLVPFQNAYDTQAFSNYFNCMFDPIDDGNTEDDFFDPTDPGRRLGPSSTCFGSVPGGTTDFNWSCIGNTDSPFATTEVCNGDTPPLNSDRPEWPPNTIDATGTWLESKLDLSAYKGRRVRVRYIVSSLKASSDTWEEQFTYNPTERDDGWWVDDISLNSALVNPALITVDTKPNTGLPACGAACTSLSAIVTVVSEQPTCDAGGNGSALGEPCGTDANCDAITAGSLCVRVVNPSTVVLDAPGQVVELNALGFDNTSEADSCQSGALQFQFVKDSVIVRQWTEDSVYVDAPVGTATYDVQVRCSTLPSCTDTHTLSAEVVCPSTGDLGVFEAVSSDGPGSFGWTVPTGFQVYRGPLGDLPDYEPGSEIASDQSGTSFVDPAVPTEDTYYLFSQDGASVRCNAKTWSSGGSAEVDGGGTLGSCDAGGNGSAEGQSCQFNAECQDIAGNEAECDFGLYDRHQNSTLPRP